MQQHRRTIRRGSRPKATAQDDRPRVLLVDDHPDGRESLAEYLELMGYQVEQRENGKGAIEAVLTGKFDVVLLDLQLPDMAGEQVVQHMIGLDVPVVAISGARTITQPRDHGFCAFVPKPCSIGGIEYVLAQAIKEDKG